MAHEGERAVGKTADCGDAGPRVNAPPPDVGAPRDLYGLEQDALTLERAERWEEALARWQKIVLLDRNYLPAWEAIARLAKYAGRR